MKIALCQMANAGSMAANLEKSLRAIETAGRKRRGFDSSFRRCT